MECWTFQNVEELCNFYGRDLKTIDKFLFHRKKDPFVPSGKSNLEFCFAAFRAADGEV